MHERPSDSKCGPLTDSAGYPCGIAVVFVERDFFWAIVLPSRHEVTVGHLRYRVGLVPEVKSRDLLRRAFAGQHSARERLNRQYRCHWNDQSHAPSSPESEGAMPDPMYESKDGDFSRSYVPSHWNPLLSERGFYGLTLP